VSAFCSPRCLSIRKIPIIVQAKDRLTNGIYTFREMPHLEWRIGYPYEALLTNADRCEGSSSCARYRDFEIQQKIEWKSHYLCMYWRSKFKGRRCPPEKLLERDRRITGGSPPNRFSSSRCESDRSALNNGYGAYPFAPTAATCSPELQVHLPTLSSAHSHSAVAPLAWIQSRPYPQLKG